MPYRAAKISFDGSHYIATPKENFPQGHKRRRAARPLSVEEIEKKEQFESAYKESQSDWVITYNNHEPIISQELWDKVQARRKSVARGRKTKIGFTHPLSGFLICADCGCEMKMNTSVHGNKLVAVVFYENRVDNGNKQSNLSEEQSNGEVVVACVLHNDFGITVQAFHECDEPIKFPWIVRNLERGSDNFSAGAQDGNGRLAFGNIDTDSVHK